jgi:hypothetical protein
MAPSARQSVGADGQPNRLPPTGERISVQMLEGVQESSVKEPSVNRARGTSRMRNTSMAIDDPMMEYTLKLMAHRINCGLGAIPVRNARRSSAVTSALPEASVKPEDVEQETEVFLGASNADPSLIMSMERTLFSAFNQAIMLTISGVGFMSVGDNNPGGTTSFGAFLLVAGLIYVLISYFMHCWRLWRLERGLGLAPYDSQIWTGLLTILIFLALLFEVFYGFKFPFLDRSKSVEIANPSQINPA